MTASNAEPMRAVYGDYYDDLRSFVTALVRGGRSGAEDVVQETMIRAWRTPKLWQQPERSIRSWLFTVARRIVIDEWRIHRNRPETVLESMPETYATSGIDALETRQVIMAAMRGLSVEHRQILAECYYRGSTVTQAAVRLGIPPGTVKSRTYYALRALKEALDAAGYQA